MTVMDQPIAKTSNRSDDGRMLPGNKLGRGNPHAKRVHRNRSLFLQAITADDMAKVTKALIDKAKSGDVQAINTFLNHAAGRPTEESAQDERAKIVRMFLVNIQTPAPNQVAVKSYVRSKVVNDRAGAGQVDAHDDTDARTNEDRQEERAELPTQNTQSTPENDAAGDAR